jgi:RNA polymerase sigma factor (sigma-70 family)
LSRLHRASEVRSGRLRAAGAFSPGEIAVPERGSVTKWIADAQKGDPQAIQHLWDRYHERLERACRHRLTDLPVRIADEEDVANTAFARLCLAVRDGRYEGIHDRNDFWRLLVTIASREVINLRNQETRQRRGGGLVRTESAIHGPGDPSTAWGADQAPSDEPTPQFTAMVAEACQKRLASLADPTLRAIAQWKLEGFSNDEIAVKLACSVKTVERKLHRIRVLWSSGNEAP